MVVESYKRTKTAIRRSIDFASRNIQILRKQTWQFHSRPSLNSSKQDAVCSLIRTCQWTCFAIGSHLNANSWLIVNQCLLLSRSIGLVKDISLMHVHFSKQLKGIYFLTGNEVIWLGVPFQQTLPCEICSPSSTISCSLFPIDFQETNGTDKLTHGRKRWRWMPRHSQQKI